MTTENIIDDIHPCPKCGERHDIRLLRIKKILSKMRFRVCCKNCGFLGLEMTALEEALNCWNFVRY